MDPMCRPGHSAERKMLFSVPGECHAALTPRLTAVGDPDLGHPHAPGHLDQDGWRFLSISISKLLPCVAELLVWAHQRRTGP